MIYPEHPYYELQYSFAPDQWDVKLTGWKPLEADRKTHGFIARLTASTRKYYGDDIALRMVEYTKTGAVATVTDVDTWLHENRPTRQRSFLTEVIAAHLESER